MTSSSSQATPLSFRRVGGQAAIYGSSLIITKVIGFLLFPVYTTYLSAEDYGVRELVTMVFDVLSIFAGSRLAVGVFRFYHKASTDAERRAVIGTAHLLVGGGYAVAGLVAFLNSGFLAGLLSEDVATYEAIIRLAAASFMVSGFVIVPMSYMRLREMAVTYVVTDTLKLLLQVGLNILFIVGLGLGVKGIFIGNLITAATVSAAVTAFIVARNGVHYSKAAALDLARFGAPLMATQGATFFTTFGDRFFLNHYADLAQVGLYGLAAQFGFLLYSIGASPFQMIWDPVRFSVASSPDRDAIYSRAFLYLNLLLLTVATLVGLGIRDMLIVMAGNPEFHAAATLVPPLLMAFIFLAWAGLQDVGIMISEKTGYSTLANWLAAAVALIAYITLIPRFGAAGSVAAAVITFGTRYGLLYHFSQQLLPVRYAWAPVLKLLALAATVVLVGMLLPPTGVILSIAVRGGLFGLYLLGVWTIGVLPPDEKQRARRILADPRSFARSLMEKPGA